MSQTRGDLIGQDILELVFVTFALKLACMEVRKLHRSAILIVAKMDLKEFLSGRPGLRLRSFLVWQQLSRWRCNI